MPSPPAGGKPQTPVTTPQVVAALGISRQTLLTWTKRGLLPEPKPLYLGRRGVSSEWPSFTIELGRYVKEALDQRNSMQTVAQMVKPLLEREQSWVEAQLEEGRTIAAILEELVNSLRG